MRSAILLGALLIAATISPAQNNAAQSESSSSQLPKLEHLHADQVNPQIDPCTDFYQYSCSKFFAANPIPADRAVWGVIGPLSLWNEVTLRQVLEAAAAKKEGRSAAEQKIGDYWSACMDESKIEQSARKDLKTELDRIAALKNKLELAGELAHLHSTIGGAWSAADAATFAPAFGFGSSPDYDDATKVIAMFDQGGFALPGREFYSNKDEKSVQLRDKYVVHIANMLKLAGEPETQAKADAAIVLAMETEMAAAAMDIVKRRDPKNINNKMTLAKLQALAPAFEWRGYLAAVHSPSTTNYIVTSPDFFRALNGMITQHPLDHWKTYLRWQMLHQSAPYLDKAFVDENFDFFARTLAGVPQLSPRWRRCVHSTDNALGEALGQAYVQRAFPPQSKERVLKMVDNIEQALGQDIAQISWMTPQTKTQAQEKLHLILDKIGYPDHWRDYSALQITPESYLENVHRATAFEFNRQLQKIGKPLDRQEWQMTPPTIDAYYDPQTNTINFPAGILQPPLFDTEQDDAANYGAEGAVIGHEITHGFDDQGRKFDGHGNLHDWWTAEDARNYDQRGKCISDEYTQQIPEVGLKQNGLLTQGEDTADNGGLNLSLIALQNEYKKEGKSLDQKEQDGLTALQKFFLAYATTWCTQYRPEIMRIQLTSNPHSLPKYRVNNVVANMPDFARAFGCKKGAPLVHENACRVW
jgi:endothelin-converting enzyme/putative endopeptidase